MLHPRPRRPCDSPGAPHDRLLPGRRWLHRTAARREHRGHPNARLRWVVDSTPRRPKRSLKKFGGRATANLDDALADPDVRAVMICTPPRTHAAIIERAARAGKAVFCEKPVDLDMSRVDACGPCSPQRDTPFFVAFNRRFDPSASRALRRDPQPARSAAPEMLVLTAATRRSRHPITSPRCRTASSTTR